ncbi:MAG: hypothetical protein FJ301_03215 [Planctomycetes bacterium]|nr:hypothetical protein [Planctomycetota bacterium]
MAWHLGLGALLVAASLGLPWWSAARTARAESRAGMIVELLLEAGHEVGRDGPPDPEVAFARLLMLARARDVFLGDLEMAAVDDEPWVVAISKHYAFRLAPIPVDAESRSAVGSSPGVAALAWPIAATGPAHTMFYAPEDGARAYTRNLTINAFGFADRRPSQQAGRRRARNPFDTRLAYRSQDDERWIIY